MSKDFVISEVEKGYLITEHYHGGNIYAKKYAFTTLFEVQNFLPEIFKGKDSTTKIEVQNA